ATETSESHVFWPARSATRSAASIVTSISSPSRDSAAPVRSPSMSPISGARLRRMVVARLAESYSKVKTVSWRTLFDVDRLHVAGALFQQDAMAAVRTPHAAIFVEFDVAFAPRTLVAHWVVSLSLPSSASAARIERETVRPPGVSGR